MTDYRDAFNFPATPEQAEEHFRKFEHLDPFAKEIPPALLNSWDISEYVRVAGIVHPFDSKNGKLKSAAYEIDFIGDVYYWSDEDKNNFTIEKIARNKPFTIPKNSIVFVSPEATFRLPDYIALRFNLRIKHVHRGLLLGTGPLVDPGFAGRLFIPLHNLTSEPYTIIGGEGLIWVEFTKISPHPHWVDDVLDDKEEYKHFPPTYRHQTPQQYLNKSSSGKPAKSSIAGISSIANEAKKDVAQAIKDVNDFEYRVKKWGGIGALVGILIGAIAILYPIYSLVAEVNSYVSTSKDSINNQVSIFQKTIDEQGTVISDLKKRIAIMEVEIKKKSPNQNGKKPAASLNTSNKNSN